VKDIIVICHGDGHQPRSGYLLALATSWTVHSIDPEMEDYWTTNSILPNLTCHRSKIEDIDLVGLCRDMFVVIVGVHSHANFDELWDRLDDVARIRVAVSLPCCAHVVHEIKMETVVDMHELEIPNKGVTIKHKFKNCHILMWCDLDMNIQKIED
jgi:hypothetical protein